jgi:hypothetical protein
VLRRLAAADGQQRRTAAVLAGVVVAAGLVVGLRAGLPEQPASGRGDAGGASWTVLPGRPFDRLPGRTPIPPPILISMDGQRVAGELPVFALAPSEAAVRIAAGMVLGRYCRNPAAHDVQLVPGPRYPLPTSGGFFPAPPGGPPPATPTPGARTATPAPTPAAVPDPAYRWMFVVVVVANRSTRQLDAVLTMRWTGNTYRWSSSLAQLNTCR